MGNLFCCCDSQDAEPETNNVQDISQQSHSSSTDRTKQRNKHRNAPAALAPNPEAPNRINHLSVIVPFSEEALLIPLSPNSREYWTIKRMIRKKTMVVDTIRKVHNPYLEVAYSLILEQKRLIYPDLKEVLLFHGTKRENVVNICYYNFNKRLAGTNLRCQHGKGVYFSSNASFASNYSGKDSFNKVLIVSKVLIGRVCAGNPRMTMPPPGYDTVQRDGSNDIVTVKFGDNEYCPVYVIYYHFEE